MLAAITRSVRSKLLVVVIVTTFTAVALVSGALMVYDLQSYEQSRVSDLTTLSDVLAAASAPSLAFHAPREAQENLNLLRVRPTILAGALFDVEGKAFAVYSPENLMESELRALGPNGYAIKGGRMLLAKSILDKAEPIGTLYLVARYEATQRLLYSGAIFSIVVIFSMLIAALVSTWLGRTLSRPILDITDAAHRVMEHRDFSVRVTKTTQDEIGYLVDAFNSMLDEVGRRAAALEDADQKKDQFLAVLAHELRNPLSPVRNAVFVLQLAKADPEKTAWATEVIDRQVRVLGRLLDDLLDVARITQNKIELRPQIIDISEIVEIAVESARPMFDANQQILKVDLPAEPTYVRADPTRMAQVLGNILTNAGKYTGRGGHIHLAVTSFGGDVVLSTKDTGIGLAPEH